MRSELKPTASHSQGSSLSSHDPPLLSARACVCVCVCVRLSPCMAQLDVRLDDIGEGGDQGKGCDL